MNKEHSPIILIPLPHGGYVVKNHDVCRHETELLFAGNLSQCLAFIAEWLSEDETRPALAGKVTDGAET